MITMPEVISKLNWRCRNLRQSMQLNESSFHNSSRFFRMQAITFSTNYAAKTSSNTKMVKLRNNIPVVKLLQIVAGNMPNIGVPMSIPNRRLLQSRDSSDWAGSFVIGELRHNVNTGAPGGSQSILWLRVHEVKLAVSILELRPILAYS